jgi:Cu2+-exporting ATPase/Cu+-exporting ATPase
MVGDGANDAIALASASVGIAVHGGLEASVRASDAYLSRPGIAQIPALIVLGRETLQLVKRNFAVSLVYNAIAATAAMAGWVTPLFAALLMPASSLLVLSSARLGTRKMRKALAEVSQ